MAGYRVDLVVETTGKFKDPTVPPDDKGGFSPGPSGGRGPDRHQFLPFQDQEQGPLRSG